ncbi:zinc-ribbon domain-containing protein [Paenibacillus puerhi]|uniref:zinc-ribbon domain-containing protein n=1 Tax=Paenibacillus puerhi TaxID=2692622 RepID=UPI00135900D9|nr:zinc ribbon domain-containing protein [Paenibacillus puerhi]
MKSIKPGRGPSAMGAAGSLFSVIFGLFWTIIAFSMTRNSPFPIVGIVFPLFGILFIGIGIVQTIYHFKNAIGRNRMSTFDIVDARDEPDPLERYVPASTRSRFNEAVREQPHGDVKPGIKQFCPYCGQRLEAEYVYCPSCGKKLE